MPRKRRQARIPTPAWERPRGTIGSRILGRSFQFYGAVAIAVLLATALGIIGYAFYADYQEKQGRPGSTAIQVEDTRLSLDYFSRRLKLYVDQFGGQGTDSAQPASAVPAVAGLLIREEIVRRFAFEFDIAATDEEIQGEIASRLGITAEDETFDVVYQQELTRSGMSEPDYRRMVEATVLINEIRQKFLEAVPQSAESVHYRQIMVSTEEAAQEVKAEIEGGADFAALAAQKSLHTQTKDSGGDVGWVPRGVLDDSVQELVFALNPGDITTIPIPQGVFVVQMLEKAQDRPIEESQRPLLAAGNFTAWAEEKKGPLKIVNNMDLSDGDPEKIQWAVSRAYQS